MNSNKNNLFLLTAGLVSCFVLVQGCTISAGLKKDPQALETRGGEPERTPIYEHEGWIIARASMHNHTIYSDGCRTPEDLLELARMQGMAVLAYNDHQEEKICGGRHELICVGMMGVAHHGFDVYFDHLRRIQETAESQGMIALKGIEIIPYVINYGRAPYVVIDGAQKHFTAYGIEDESVFSDLPTRDYVPLKPEPIPGDAPYAELVDYIVDNGGIAHAVHVCDGDDTWMGPAHGAVPPPVHHVHSLKNLTGFSVLPSGWCAGAGAPGGNWDLALIEYLGGMRQKPLWAMADADYHCEASLAVATTLMYMQEFTEEEVYRCLREGRMVALQGDEFQDTYVAEWWVSGKGEPENPVMLGQEVVVKGAPVIKFALDHPVEGCRVKLIRNGIVVREEEGTELTFRDEDQGKKAEPAYYRVEVVGPRADRGLYEGPTMPQSELFVNPIFVKFSR